jgi:hypothetical protein
VISDLLAMLIFSRRLKISDLLAMLIFSRRLAQPLPGSSILRSSCSAVAWIIWSNSASSRGGELLPALRCDLNRSRRQA